MIQVKCDLALKLLTESESDDDWVLVKSDDFVPDKSDMEELIKAKEDTINDLKIMENKDAVFRMDPLLYHKFENMVTFSQEIINFFTTKNAKVLFLLELVVIINES